MRESGCHTVSLLFVNERWHRLVDVKLTVTILKKAVQAKLAAGAGALPGILVDGFPREVPQVAEFEAQFGRSCDVLLFLETSEAVNMQRLLSRAETSGRSDDNEAAIAQRLAVYRDKTSPVVAAFTGRNLLRTIDADGDRESVWLLAKPVLESLGSPALTIASSVA